MIIVKGFQKFFGRYFKQTKPIRRATLNGKVYLRYSGAHLRAIRAVKGVGRPISA